MENNEINIKEIFQNGFGYEDIENLVLLCNTKEEVQKIYESIKNEKSYEDLPPDKKVSLCYFVYEVIPVLKNFQKD